MKKVALYTLGCKVNQYETEAMTGLFEKEGYQVVDFDQPADVYVINTCTVTNLSDRKSRQMIRKAKRTNPGSIVAVVGCYAQTAPEEVKDIPGVNLIVGTKDRANILDYIKQVEENKGHMDLVDNIMTAHDFEELKVESYKERTRAYLKIQEGCSQFCSYCIIPYARGPIRSRAPSDILQEVTGLADSGFREVVLTGIHIASYGRDIGGTSLLEIIKGVHAVEGIDRIRLGSIEPTTITEEFVRTAASLPRLCPHYHVSLQSGSNSTLKRMNRRYTAEQYRESIMLLRKHIPDVAVTTDVMVGFPGETEEEFDESLRFVEGISFAQMHVFKYSPRKGTPAAGYPDQVPPAVKEVRSEKMLELSREKTALYQKDHIGRRLPVLFEQTAKDERYVEGLTPNYIRVLCEGDINLKGAIRDVNLLEIKEDYMLGTVVE